MVPASWWKGIQHLDLIVNITGCLRFCCVLLAFLQGAALLLNVNAKKFQKLHCKHKSYIVS